MAQKATACAMRWRGPQNDILSAREIAHSGELLAAFAVGEIFASFQRGYQRHIHNLGVIICLVDVRRSPAGRQRHKFTMFNRYLPSIRHVNEKWLERLRVVKFP